MRRLMTSRPHAHLALVMELHGYGVLHFGSLFTPESWFFWNDATLTVFFSTGTHAPSHFMLTRMFFG